MTFREVSVKNFKNNIQKFFSYFLCSSFSIMIFFIYASVLFNDELNKKHSSSNISMMFDISLTALFVFSVFFINYAHTAFIKSRNKEFGVYLTLGMNSSDLRKILNTENLIIIFTSLIAGLGFGTLFSRLFEMIVMKLLNITDVSYSLSYKSYALTIAVFAAIFIMVMVLSSLQTKKLDISDLLKESKRKEKTVKNPLVPGVIGVAVLIGAFIMLAIICNHEKLRSNVAFDIAYIILSFIGAYMIISYIGGTIIKLIKGSSYYYKNILSVTEINYKFNENKRIIFILSILSAMTITFVSSPLSLYSLSESIAQMNSTGNIEFIQLGDINKLQGNTLQNIVKTAQSPVKCIKSAEFAALNLASDQDKLDILKSKPVISQKIYNEITGMKLQLKKGEAVEAITSWMPGYHLQPSTKIKFLYGPKSFDFTVINSAHLKWVGSMEEFASSSGIIVSDEDYAIIKNNISKADIGHFNTVRFKDWKKTEHAVDKLIKKLNQNNNKLMAPYKKLSPLFPVVSTIKHYKELKQGYSFFIFVAMIMGILFFIAGGSVLFFKKYAELGKDKERFYKLYKIGICEDEAIKVISKELKVLFFTPLIMGSILGYSYIYLLTFTFGGGDIIKQFMLNATYGAIAYFLFQAVFYFMTKVKYTKEVIRNIG